MKVLSLGAGMQSTALALMACENVANPGAWPLVPVYDAVIFCDLGQEPPWVYEQVEFIKDACKKAGIAMYILRTGLADDILNNFGKSRVVAIPFWTISEDGKPGRMGRRACTLDYKVFAIQKFVRWQLLGYRKGERTHPEDIGAHEMHIGFSNEEQDRIFDSKHPFFVNKFPLIEMGMERKDNYQYILETWGLATKASACTFCPFHQNYFFHNLRDEHPNSYKNLVKLDNLLGTEQPNTYIRSQIFISRSRKRICELADEECNDGQFFPYRDKMIWNGF